jgi:hypothetical protein
MAEHLESLSALECLLEVGPASALTPEQVETRVERVIALMARSAYDEAARASEALLREGIRDVRLVSPYVFGAFLAHGPKVLPSLFSALHRVFTQGWEQLEPGDSRTPLADSGLLWLFKSIHKHLEFHGRAQDDVWRSWCENCTQPHVQEALQKASALAEFLEQQLPGGGGVTRLIQVTGWLSENRELFPETPTKPGRAQAAEPKPAHVNKEHALRVEKEDDTLAGWEEDADEPYEELDEEERVDEEPEDVEVVRPRAPSAPRMRAALPPELEHSPALGQLLQKLTAFDQLVDRQDFSRASMVATDVLHVIDHFDPLVYLPSLFSRFLSGLSSHAADIEPLMQGSKSFSERALERLYRTDMEAFLNFGSEAEDEP